MTDEERAEMEHRISLYRESLLMNAKGLGATAKRIEDAIKAGDYDQLDAPALAELVSILAHTQHRVAWYLAYKDEDK